MIKFSEWEKAVSDDRKEKRKCQVQLLRSILEQAESVTVVTSEQLRDTLRACLRGIVDGTAKAVGQDIAYFIHAYDISCDVCGCQLIDPTPGVTMLSSPPQRRIQCPGCGWSGYVNL